MFIFSIRCNTKEQSKHTDLHIRLEWQVFHVFYCAKKVELNLIHEPQKTFLNFNQSYILSIQNKYKKIYFLAHLVLLREK